MHQLDLAVADGQISGVLTALVEEPKLAAFLAFLIVAGLITAAIIFRNHKFRILRKSSSDGTRTSVVVDPPAKVYERIGGLIEADVQVEKKKEAS